MIAAPILALASALALAAPPKAGTEPRLAVDLAIFAPTAPAAGSSVSVPGAPEPGTAPSRAPPVCSGDLCQPVVSVPGHEPTYGRAHRSELFVALLDRAHIEPLATIAWALVSTGLRLEYDPPAFDGEPAGRAHWGSVFVRMKVRIDAYDRPVFPKRRR